MLLEELQINIPQSWTLLPNYVDKVRLGVTSHLTEDRGVKPEVACFETRAICRIVSHLAALRTWIRKGPYARAGEMFHQLDCLAPWERFCEC